MKDQERLAEQANDIRNDLSEIIMVLQDKEDLQERVKQLEKENDHHKQRMKDYHLQAVRNGTKLDECKDEIDRLEKQNKRYEEALRNIDEYERGMGRKGLEPQVFAEQALQNNREG